jgi:tRNA(adenine34) deaminase
MGPAQSQDQLKNKLSSEQLHNAPLTDQQWMEKALELSGDALQRGEPPVGAILVSEDGVILGQAGNARGSQGSPLEHAEIIALRRAARRTGDWRFPNATLYVTLEPCPMCAGAIVGARVSRLVFGAYNDETGCASSLVNLADLPGARTSVQVIGGVLESRCAGQLKSFFQARRGGRARLNAPDSKSGRG